MEGSPFLPLPKGLLISQVHATDTQLTVVIVATGESASCPGCGAPSEHLHSHYMRTVTDVACGGPLVLLQLHVRKFRCLTLTCPRRIFTERLPELVQPWARVTNRLLEELKALGLATSAQVSERLAPRLGMQVKAPTLLRYLGTISPPCDAPVHRLGLDDFSLRRGDCYGTILVNLETHRPLDLLPDRTAEAVLPWLKKHPEITVVSRDRASAYADAVRRALPHATQVADRYHLVQNLREHLQRWLDHKRTCLPVVEDTLLKEGLAHDDGNEGFLVDQVLAETALPSTASPDHSAEQSLESVSKAPQGRPIEPEMELSCLTYAERKKKISRDKRLARYEQVLALHQAGLGQRAIARELHMSRHVVQRFLRAEAFPERAAGSGLPPVGKSKLAPYLAYLRERWEAGTHNSSRLLSEIKQRGYTGSASLLRRLLAQWRSEQPPKPRQGKPRKPRLASQPRKRHLSSRSAAFLMILPPNKLSERQQQQLEQMSHHEELHRAYLLAQEFLELLKERKAEQLPAWLKGVAESQITELKSCANGIRRDYAAVYAACSLSCSNGLVEGHINRLKLIKRQMFGRAHLDLLGGKVLHAV